MVANLCFLFSSSFRYVKFQVTREICQSGNRGQTTKKTRAAAATTEAKAQGLKRQNPPRPQALSFISSFFKISPERTQESGSNPGSQEGAVTSPQWPREDQEPSDCQTWPVSVCKNSPQKEDKPASSAQTQIQKSFRSDLETRHSQTGLVRWLIFHGGTIHTPRCDVGTQMPEYKGTKASFAPQQITHLTWIRQQYRKIKHPMLTPKKNISRVSSQPCKPRLLHMKRGATSQGLVLSSPKQIYSPSPSYNELRLKLCPFPWKLRDNIIQAGAKEFPLNFSLKGAPSPLNCLPLKFSVNKMMAVTKTTKWICLALPQLSPNANQSRSIPGIQMESELP